jgi:hypothetical protein
MTSVEPINIVAIVTTLKSTAGSSAYSLISATPPEKFISFDSPLAQNGNVRTLRAMTAKPGQSSSLAMMFGIKTSGLQYRSTP